MDKCPSDLRYLNGGVKTFVKTLTAGKSIGKYNIVIFLPQQFQIFLVIFMNKDATLCIFQVTDPK